MLEIPEQFDISGQEKTSKANQVIIDMNTTPKAPNERARIEFLNGWYWLKPAWNSRANIHSPDGGVMISGVRREAAEALAAAMNTPPQTNGQAGDGECRRVLADVYAATQQMARAGRETGSDAHYIACMIEDSGELATPAPAAIPVPTVTAESAAREILSSMGMQSVMAPEDFIAAVMEKAAIIQQAIDAAKALPAAPKKEEA